jgi:hypothetical protein
MEEKRPDGGALKGAMDNVKRRNPLVEMAVNMLVQTEQRLKVLDPSEGLSVEAGGVTLVWEDGHVVALIPVPLYLEPAPASSDPAPVLRWSLRRFHVRELASPAARQSLGLAVGLAQPLIEAAVADVSRQIASLKAGLALFDPTVLVATISPVSEAARPPSVGGS